MTPHGPGRQGQDIKATYPSRSSEVGFRSHLCSISKTCAAMLLCILGLVAILCFGFRVAVVGFTRFSQSAHVQRHTTPIQRQLSIIHCTSRCEWFGDSQTCIEGKITPRVECDEVLAHIHTFQALGSSRSHSEHLAESVCALTTMYPTLTPDTACETKDERSVI